MARGNGVKSAGVMSAGEGERRVLGGALPYIAVLVIYGLFLGFFNNMYAYKDFERIKFDLLSASSNGALAPREADFKRTLRNVQGSDKWMLMLDKDTPAIPFVTYTQGTLILKLSMYLQRAENNPATIDVMVNGRRAVEASPRWEGGIEEFYLPISAEYLKQGANQVAVTTNATGGRAMGIVDASLKNYTGMSNNFPRTFIVYDEVRKGLGLRAFRHPFDYLFFPAALLLLWAVAANIGRAAGGRDIGQAVKKVLKINIPVAILLAIVTAFSLLSESDAIVDYRHAIWLSALPFLLYMLYHSASFMLSGRLFSLFGGLGGRGRAGERGTRTIALSRASGAGQVARTVCRNAATAAILVFMACLVTAGVLLVIKHQGGAERMADIAYFALVVGVVLRIFDVGPAEHAD